MRSLEPGPPELVLAAAEAALEKETDPLKTAWLRLLAGHINLRMRRYSEIGETAGKIGGDESLPGQLRAHGLFLKAQKLFADALIEETKAVSEEAITLYDGDDDNIAALHMNILGACCRQLNQFRKALDYYEMGLERELKFNPESPTRGLYSYNAALVHIEIGNLAEAREALEKALEIEKERDDPVMAAHTTSSIAGLLSLQGKYEEGLQYAEKAFAGLQDVKNYHIRTVNLLVLSDIHLALGNLDEAQEFAEQCLAFAEKSGEKILMLEAKLLLAVVLAEVKSPAAEEKLSEALEFYDEAISGKPQLNLEKALIAYGKILSEKNHPGAYGCLIRAEKYLEKRTVSPQVDAMLTDLQAYMRDLPSSPEND